MDLSAAPEFRLPESGLTGVKAFRWAEVHGKKAS